MSHPNQFPHQNGRLPFGSSSQQNHMIHGTITPQNSSFYPPPSYIQQPNFSQAPIAPQNSSYYHPTSLPINARNIPYYQPPSLSLTPANMQIHHGQIQSIQQRSDVAPTPSNTLNIESLVIMHAQYNRIYVCYIFVLMHRNY